MPEIFWGEKPEYEYRIVWDEPTKIDTRVKRFTLAPTYYLGLSPNKHRQSWIDLNVSTHTLAS